jgi:segregation and condensation protein A
MAEEKATHLTIAVPRFDGPFDVLLSLIRRNEWLIDDLPVAEITRQFLAYLKSGVPVDAELGGEFIETASWLVLLKSRSLLPVDDPEGPLLPQEELRRAVLDHATLAATTELLRGRYDQEMHPGSAGSPAGRRDAVLAASADDAPTLDDLLRATLEALASARAAASFSSLDATGPTIEQQARWITTTLAAMPINTAVSVAEWFDAQPDNAARVALLLALLELARKGFLLLHQAEDFASIRIKAVRELPQNIQIEEQAFVLRA